MLKSLLFILISFSLLSCGATSDEKLNEVLLDAQIALGSNDCQHAIDVLEANGRVNNHAHYLKTLASAYACRAGYSTTTFFSTDMSLTATPPPLGGMSLYSTSSIAVTSPFQTDARFEDLQKAINILLYAGGIPSTKEPTANERAKYFSSDEAGDINSQLLYMELVQLGKYMRHYGNGSSTAGANGLKGTGSASNKCFTSYDNSPLKADINLLPGTFTCRSSNSSHAELQGPVAGIGGSAGINPASTRKTRLCHGLVLLNGVFELLPSVVGAASGGSLAAVSGLTLVIDGIKTILVAADTSLNMSTNVTLTTINQSVCEDDTAVSVANIESYFFGMMESIFL
jgi:hypothetical protein